MNRLENELRAIQHLKKQVTSNQWEWLDKREKVLLDEVERGRG